MPKMTECAVCGQMFVVRTRGKYCPDCRDAANKAKKLEIRNRLKEKRKAEKQTTTLATGDGPERIHLCLNCTRKTCTGNCKELKSIKESNDD